jgi:hypothetical protein
MLITKQFLDDAGRRSPMARSAMVQAGDKARIGALKAALVSIGVCEISQQEAEELKLPLRQKKYAFLAGTMTFALLDENTFARFKPLADPVSLEIAHARNGLIGIRYSGKLD